MNRMSFALCLVICYVSDIDGKSNKHFQVNLKYAKECVSPNPPFPKERTVLTVVNIQNQKEKALMSGRHSFLAEVPFQNFSVTGYKVDSYGKKVLQTFIENLACHSWICKAYLNIGNIRFYKKDCRVRKGVYEYRNLDMNAVMHRVPTYYTVGMVLYRMQLVHNSSTLICEELLISIK